MKGTVLPLVVTLAIQAFVSMTSATVPVFAPVAAADIGVAVNCVGIFVALIYVGGMLSSLVSGDIILRYGALRVSQGCLLFCALGIALTSIGTVSAMILSGLLIGFGYGSVTPASSHILVKTTPPHQLGMMFSLKQTGVPLGGAIAGAVIPTLVMMSNWRKAALVIASLSLVTALLAQMVRGEIDADRDLGQKIRLQGMVDSFKLVLHQCDLRRLALLSFFYATLQLCLVTYLVTYLTKTFGISLVLAGLTLSVAQSAGVIGRFWWGVVADRYLSPGKLLGLLGLLMALCGTVTGFFTASWPFFLIMLICGIFGSAAIGWNGVYLAEIARLAPLGKAGIATGGSLFFTYLGVVIGPPVFAGIVSLSGSYSAGYLIFSVPVLALSLTFLYRLKHGSLTPSVSTIDGQN